MRTLDGRIRYRQTALVVLAVIGSCAAVAAVAGAVIYGVMKVFEAFL